MSTNAKGNALEEKIFTLLPELVRRIIGAPNDRCKTFRRRSYHSIIREGAVNFENVIEIYLADEFGDRPTLSLVFECKNTKRVVDVAELEEFQTKICGIRDSKIKGYIVSQAGFSRKCFSFAKNSGIGLIRSMPDDQVTFLVNFETGQDEVRRPPPQDIARALQTPEYESRNYEYYGYDRGFGYCSLDDLMRSAIED